MHAEYGVEGEEVIGLAACDLPPPPGSPRLNGAVEVTIDPDSRCAAIYGATAATEYATCSYTLSPAYQPAFDGSPLNFTGHDRAGNVVLAELDGHPFFIGALFLPQAKALDGELHPLIEAFLAAASRVS